MDATTINTIVGIVGIVVGIIGAIIGIIGWKSLSEATKIKNSAKADNGATVYQAQTINNGVSDDTVRLISKDITKEQLCRLVTRLIPVNTDDENCIANRMRRDAVSAEKFEEILEEIPEVYYGKTEPPDFPSIKDGAIWYRI